MEPKVCEGPGCQVVFTPKRKNAKYHEHACQMRAHRNPGQAGPKPPPKTSGPRKRAAEAGQIEVATRRELGAKADTGAGLVALLVARRLDGSAADTSAAVAALAREHATAMDRALSGDSAEDPIAGRVTRIDSKLRRARDAGHRNQG